MTENQATDYIKTTTTPKIHQQHTVIQKEVIPKTRPQEEITPQKNHDTSKSLPNAKVYKLGNNLSLKQRENVKKNTLIAGDSIIKHIGGWCLNKRIRSTVSV